MVAFLRAIVEGVGELVNKLRNRAERSQQKDRGFFTVGYAAPYALFVHEDLQAQHEHGQAKFLERPTRELHGELASQIRLDVGRDLGLEIANKNAAITLLQKSQELVPVDTGALKASGYVRDQDNNTVYGSEETAEEILAWRQLIKDRDHRRQQLEQRRKTKE